YPTAALVPLPSHTHAPIQLHSSPFFSPIRPPPTPTLFPYTTLFRSIHQLARQAAGHGLLRTAASGGDQPADRQRLSALRANLDRSEEHTSELQSRSDLVCRLLLEKKKKSSTDE